jgi:hypothetical protein
MIQEKQMDHPAERDLLAIKVRGMISIRLVTYLQVCS